jgi:hypothetical protein
MQAANSSENVYNPGTPGFSCFVQSWPGDKFVRNSRVMAKIPTAVNAYARM